MELYYRSSGHGNPLIILHGLFGSSDNWMGIGKQFARRYEVIIPDLRNHGRSPHSSSWDYPAMAHDIFELTQKTGMTSIRLLGHSMGGKVAMAFAATHPSLVHKLVIADIAPRRYPVHHRSILDGLLSIVPGQLSGRKEADEILSRYVPEAGVRQFLLKNLERTGDTFRWKLNLEEINRQIENVGMSTYPDEVIKTPTLFARGANSDYISDGDIMEIRQFFSHAQVETIRNAGHWLHAEQPAAFLQIVSSFLQD